MAYKDKFDAVGGIEPVTVLCRQVFADHPEMNTDFEDHQPVKIGSKRHRHRLQSKEWELLPVHAHPPAQTVPEGLAELLEVLAQAVKIHQDKGVVLTVHMNEIALILDEIDSDILTED